MSTNNESNNSTALELPETGSDLELRETSAAVAPSIDRPRRRSRAPRPSEDDSWWTAIEHDDLILDELTPSRLITLREVPNLVASAEDNGDDTNFDRLHKIADKIKSTLNEHMKNRAESVCNQPPNSTASMSVCSTLEEFKADLELRRKSRQHAVQELRDEIHSLRRQLQIERDLTRRLRNGDEITNTNNTFAITNTNVQTNTNTSTQPNSNSNIIIMQKNLNGNGLANVNCLSENYRGERADVEKDDDYFLSMSTSSSRLTGCTAKKQLNFDVLGEDIDDRDPLSRSRHANIELANAQLALQMANSDNISLRSELAVVQKQVVTLKEVISCCKQMLNVKEEQCSEVRQITITDQT